MKGENNYRRARASHLSAVAAVGMLVLFFSFFLVSPSQAQEPLVELEALLDAKPLDEGWNEARDLVRQLVDLHGPDSPVVGQAILLVARKWFLEGVEPTDELRDLIERGLDILRRDAAGDTLETAELMRILGGIFLYRADLERARSQLEEALAVEERLAGPESVAVAETLQALAWQAAWAGDFDRAMDLCGRSMEMIEARRGDADLLLAGCLELQIQDYGNAGRLEESLSAAQRMVAIAERHGADRPQETVQAYNALASVLTSLGRYAEAEETLKRALELADSAMLHFNLGLLLDEMGDRVEARRHVERAIEIWRRAGIADDPSVAIGEQVLGTLLLAGGDLDEARRHLERALAMRERRSGQGEEPIAGPLSALAELRIAEGELEEAEILLQRALAVAKAVTSRGAVLWVLGDLRLRQRDLEGARRQFAAVLDLRLQAFGPGSAVVQQARNDLAGVELRLGLEEEARRHYSDAVEALRAAQLEEHPEMARAIDGLAGLALAAGRRDRALELSRQASRLVLDYAGASVARLGDRQGLLFVGQVLRPETTLFEGLLSASDDRQLWLDAAWEWSLGRRGIVLEATVLRHRAALAGSTPEIRSAWEELRRARQRLAALWSLGAPEDPEAHARALRIARLARDRAERRLGAAGVAYEGMLAARRVAPAELLAMAPPRAVVVEVVQVPLAGRAGETTVEHDVALVARSGGPAGAVDLGPSEVVDRAVSAWRRALQDTASVAAEGGAGLPASVSMAGSELRHLVWDPLTPWLQGADEVLLVPEGGLNLVDFAALNRDDGGFLAEEGWVIHDIDSLRALGGGARGRVEMGPLLALGDPDLDRESSLPSTPGSGAGEPAFRDACPALGDRVWSPLPAARKEVDTVAARWAAGGGQTVRLLGAAASEGGLRDAVGGQRVLHVASHGFFLGGACPGPGGASGISDVRSGLVLAGANRPQTPATSSEDDGFLTDVEITSLDLRSVDLAVLSACDTGRGDPVLGEGVLGMQRSLAAAGVKRTVLSLWPVPDRETGRQMSDFYDRLVEGEPVERALAGAKLGALEALRERGLSVHPYLWAGFVSASSAASD